MCVFFSFRKWICYVTYLRKYFWPLDVKAISHPGGSGSSSATSKDWCRMCAWCTGLGVELVPTPSWKDAGKDFDRACACCCSISLGGWLPESVLDCREWDPESGSLKKDSGKTFFLQELGLGFITELKSASRSVSESFATWITWCPGRGCRGLLLILVDSKLRKNINYIKHELITLETFFDRPKLSYVVFAPKQNVVAYAELMRLSTLRLA